jgi:hypothetical protein
METRKRVLGSEHPDTLTSMNNWEKVLGPEHPDTLTSVSNLGSLLQSQGKYEEAEAMHRRALEEYENI